MEHQSAVAYGNGFKNGLYGAADWTGTGISLRFDFIIIHESGHEWFGISDHARRSVGYVDSRGDRTTYLESLYVEIPLGNADASNT